MIELTFSEAGAAPLDLKPARKARKPRASKPPAPPKVEKPKRAKPVRLVTAYLASMTEHHVAAADVLGAEFKSLLRDELALDAKVRALISRRDSLEHDLQQVGEALNGCHQSQACRNRLDVLARDIAKAKGAVPLPDDEPTEDDRKGVDRVTRDSNGNVVEHIDF